VTSGIRYRILQETRVEYRERTLAIVDKAEKEVLEVLADEAKQGRYDGIEFARLIARRLRDLRHSLVGVKRGTSQNDETPLDDLPKRVRTRNQLSSGNSRGAYPKFKVEDGTLVRLGWSKKEKAQYFQRVPGEAFDRVTAALGALASRREGSHTGDAILDAVNAGDKTVPSYQAYAILGFLRDRGTIRMPSRGEYVLPVDIETLARAELADTEG
jgi:hypothetical protein